MGNSSILMVFRRKDKDLSTANCGLLEGICRLNVSQDPYNVRKSLFFCVPKRWCQSDFNVRAHLVALEKMIEVHRYVSVWWIHHQRNEAIGMWAMNKYLCLFSVYRRLYYPVMWWLQQTILRGPYQTTSYFWENVRRFFRGSSEKTSARGRDRRILTVVHWSWSPYPCDSLAFQWRFDGGANGFDVLGWQNAWRIIPWLVSGW